MIISLAAMFLVKILTCRVKNTRKMSNLAVLFFLAFGHFLLKKPLRKLNVSSP